MRNGCVLPAGNNAPKSLVGDNDVIGGERHVGRQSQINSCGNIGEGKNEPRKIQTIGHVHAFGRCIPGQNSRWQRFIFMGRIRHIDGRAGGGTGRLSQGGKNCGGQQQGCGGNKLAVHTHIAG